MDLSPIVECFLQQRRRRLSVDGSVSSDKDLQRPLGQAMFTCKHIQPCLEIKKSSRHDMAGLPYVLDQAPRLSTKCSWLVVSTSCAHMVAYCSCHASTGRRRPGPLAKRGLCISDSSKISCMAKWLTTTFCFINNLFRLVL